MAMTADTDKGGLGYRGYLSMDSIAKSTFSPDMVASAARESWEKLIIAHKWTAKAYIHQPMRDPALFRDILLYNDGLSGGRNKDIGEYVPENRTVEEVLDELALHSDSDDETDNNANDGKTAPIDRPAPKKRPGAPEKIPHNDGKLLPSHLPETMYLPPISASYLAPTLPAHGHPNNNASFGDPSPQGRYRKPGSSSRASSIDLEAFPPRSPGPRPPISRGNSDLIFPFELGEGRNSPAGIDAERQKRASVGPKILATGGEVASRWEELRGSLANLTPVPTGDAIRLPHNLTEQGRQEAREAKTRAAREKERAEKEAADAAIDLGPYIPAVGEEDSDENESYVPGWNAKGKGEEEKIPGSLYGSRYGGGPDDRFGSYGKSTF